MSLKLESPSVLLIPLDKMGLAARGRITCTPDHRDLEEKRVKWISGDPRDLYRAAENPSFYTSHPPKTSRMASVAQLTLAIPCNPFVQVKRYFAGQVPIDKGHNRNGDNEMSLQISCRNQK
ncbi:unnamed protein product [Caretta caretta]